VKQVLSTFRIALGAMLLCSSASALAYEPQPDPAAQSAGEQGARGAQPQRRPGQDEPLICRTVEVAGTGGATPMVCMPAADWQRAPQ
jgi:hypothetical protein